MTVDARACPACHTPLPPEAHFCLNCGTPTPTEPGVPPRTMPTGTVEVTRVRAALADRYKVERVLGEGGMATVYLAVDLKHHRQVAVKVMRPELAETLGAERFLREVEIAARLSHPHILPVYDSGAAEGILYYVMPFVEGESLPARLRREKQLPLGEALRLAREVAEALAYAHRHGFVHRDIKPANILLSGGHALVADFGIARAMSSEGRPLTQTGLAIGTPQYMSPEQASGAADVDGRTDIYSLGCVLYEMLAGEPPFTGPTAQAIISRSITEEPRPLEQTRANLPPQVGRAVRTALAKAPADRYGDAAEMVAGLQAAEDARRSGAVEAPMPVRSALGWRRMLLGAVGVLALGALGAKLFSGAGFGDEPTGRRVAVLPFINQGDEEDSYFADGIVDEVRGKLASIAGLSVTASASANQYRESSKTGPEIARELKVDQVLMGRVRWSGPVGSARRVQVVTELVDGRTGQTTWQDTFEADAGDVFQLQGRIATRVASALGRVLRQDDEVKLAARPTGNVAAYDLYLKAKAITNNSAVTQRTAANYLEQAVALDADFAEAWALLGEALSNVYINGTRDPAVRSRANEAIERALQLAEGEGFTHRAASEFYALVERDDTRARREINRALAINPNDAEILALSAQADFRTEEFGAALDKITRARELDPLSVQVTIAHIRALVYLGRLEDAKAVGEELLALDPTAPGPLEWAAVVHLAGGDLTGARQVVSDALNRGVQETELVSYFAGYNELAFVLDDAQLNLLFRLTPAAFDNDRAWWGQALSIAARQRGDLVRSKAYADSSLTASKAQSDANPDDPQLRALYAVMLAYAGRLADASREADRAVTDAPENSNLDQPYARMQRVRVRLASGDFNGALDDLEAVLGRQYHVTPGYLKVDPTFAPLRGNPRFDRLLARPIRAAID